MTKAILADINANIEALEAVLADLRSQGLTEADVLCLGDMIGYGPNPRECLQACLKFSFNLLGNHEEAILFYPEDLSPLARQVSNWTREELNSRKYPKADKAAYWDFIAGLDPSAEREETLYIHASPRHPTRDYVFPEDGKDAAKMKEVFAGVPRWGFHGHTHVAGVMLESGRFVNPGDVGGKFTLGSEKALVNPGSVGQPRDGDTRASYATVDGDTVTFHRVAYDIEAVIRKMQERRLPAKLAERLRVGK